MATVSIALVQDMMIMALVVYFVTVLAWTNAFHAAVEDTIIVLNVMEMDMYIAIDVMDMVS